MYTFQRVLVALLLIIVVPTSARAQNVPAPVDTSAAVKRDTVRQVPTYPVAPIPAPSAIRTEDEDLAIQLVTDSAAGDVALAPEASADSASAASAPVRVTKDGAAVAAVAAPPLDSVRLVTRLLVANGAPEHRARPAAAAVMKYARLRGLDPLLLVGIIGVENAELVPRSKSRVGATGVMQVMPFWKKYIRDCGTNLSDVHTNVCFGTRILRIAMDETTSLRAALLRYNGCVKSPGCHRYASAVFSRTGQAMIMSRAMATPATVSMTSTTSMRETRGG